MSLYNPCPVCTSAVSARERQCPHCAWELESDYVLGRLTPEDETMYQEHLGRAREGWRLHQQQRAAQRTLTLAQARLQRLQHAGMRPRREPDVVVPEAAPPSSFPSARPAQSASEPLPLPRVSLWHPLHFLRVCWWALFRPEQLGRYSQRQRGDT
jgi:hypothetical protein